MALYRSRLALASPLLLAAIVTVGAAVAMVPAVASAGVFSFARTDHLLETYLVGLDSVAVADLDGKNGPDIIVESLTAGTGLGTVNVLLNNGDGTFAPAQAFDSCDGANSIVVGQFNPETDGHLDVALICGNQQEIGRMLGDGQGNLGPVQTVGVGYLTGASLAAVVEYLRLGAMDGPTLVFGGYLAGLGTTLCFLRVSDFEFDIDGGGSNPPYCDLHINDIVGSPNYGQIDDWGPISNDIAVGEDAADPGEPFARDEAVSGGESGFSQIPVAVTAYTPYLQSTWSYGARSSGNTGTAVALADLDHDGQNDLLIGGSDLLIAADAEIADYVPGWPIELGATPTHSFGSVPYLYDMVTADFDGDGKVDVAAIGDDDDNDDGITVGIHRGNGDGTFAPYERFTARGYVTTGAGEQMIAVGDFDQNGSPDLVTVGRLDAWASVLLNGPAGGSCAPYDKPRLALGDILAPSGDDTLGFAGALAAPATPPDPDLHGLAIALEDAGGLVTDATIPPGSYDKTAKSGWKVDKKRTKWVWTHSDDGSLGGFVKAVVALRKGKLVTTLKGRNGSYAATAPVAIAVTFPASSECGRADFGTAGHSCLVKSKGKTLSCS